MEDEDEAATEETTEKRDPQKWAWINFFSILVASVGAWCHLWALIWSQVSDLMDDHHAWKLKEKDMQRQAALEIEALTRELVPVEVE